MSDTDRRPVFAVPFSWDSSIGHLVELVVDHVEPGLVVELDAGVAPAAERLAQRGFRYAATVARPEEMSALSRRGVPAVVLDLDRAGADEIAAALRSLVGDERPAAVLLDGVLDRATDPDRLLTGVRLALADHPVARVAVSVANVAHRAVALPMLEGRFEPFGPGPHHHTAASLRTRMAAVGLVETHRLDRVAPQIATDRGDVDPVLSQGALLGALLHRLRTETDPHGDVADIVALFAPGTPPAPSAGDRAAMLAVAVPAGLPAETRAELVRRLDQQDSADFELVDLGDDPIAVLRALPNPYAVVLHGDELPTPGWVGQFVATLGVYPGAIVRCASAAGAWAPRDNFYGLLDGQTAPDGAFAFPTALLRSVLPALDGGALDLYPLLLVGSATSGIVDTGVPALDGPETWDRGSDVAAARSTLDDGPFLVPVGSAGYLADQQAQLRDAHTRTVELAAENAALRAQLQRRPVALVVTAMGAVGRLRRRFTRR